ncbi:hypothetical protein Pfo_030200 [Paulownia fortunei]|nr:hypothetical protein Pfo_030200 [Paulownia fortunei]
MTSRTILVAKNEYVYKLNNKLIFMFPKEIRNFNNYDETIDDTNNYYIEDFLNSLIQNSLSPHKMNNVIDTQIKFGQHTRKHIFKPKILLFSVEKNVYPFQFKFQGQTIPNVGIYLPHLVFSHGQLYIDISKGTPISTLKVLIKLDTTNVREKTWTKNVIYRQASKIKRENNEFKTKIERYPYDSVFDFHNFGLTLIHP